jgi:hypothetical protein
VLKVCLAGCLFAAAAGCESTSNNHPLKEQINTLRQEKTQLQKQIEESKSENKQLKKQIQVLSGLPHEAGAEKLYSLQRIKISNYTNFYDKDKDGKKEKLIVYIQPIDAEGDIIKAAGDVDVQLWDLNKKDGQALLGQWHVKAEDLKKVWFATLITINYRLTFDVAEEIADFDEPLTVKVTFTDYLTGKVFKEQKVIKPR